MNSDIRIAVDFWSHPKTGRLLRAVGVRGARSLQILWMWAARNRPDGKLAGLDAADIEYAADWRGKKGAFFAAVDGQWLDGTDEGYELHDWLEHNPWAADAEGRSQKALFSKLAQVNPDAHQQLKARGIGAISREEYGRWKAEKGGSERGVDQRTASGSPAIRQRTPGEPPAPSPLPSPSPVEPKEGDAPVRPTADDGATGAGAPGIPVGPEAHPARPVKTAPARAVADGPPGAEGSLGGPAVDATASEPALVEAGGGPEDRGDQPQPGPASKKRAGESARTPLPAAPDWLPQELWDRWQAHRGALKKPLSADGALLTLARLEKAKGFGHDPAELLKTAIANGWQGCVFPDTHYRAAAVRAPSAPREGSRPALREPPADPAAYRKTDGFAAELALEEA